MFDDPTLYYISVTYYSLPKEEQQFKTKGFYEHELSEMDVAAIATEILADLREQKGEWVK